MQITAHGRNTVAATKRNPKVHNDMNKFLITLALAAVMTVNTGATTQAHRHTPRTQTEETSPAGGGAKAAAEDGKSQAKASAYAKAQQQKAAAKKQPAAAGAKADEPTDELEAYSDTTEVYETDSATTRSYQLNIDEDGMDRMVRGFGWLADGMIGTLFILLIIFVFSPVAIIAVICYFIYKNRKQKLQLAEMAMKNGQKIPEELLSRQAQADDELWRKGIKNIFLGIGLIFFFSFMGFDTGIGIGGLVIFSGLGQAVIARTSVRRNNRRDAQEFPDDTDVRPEI